MTTIITDKMAFGGNCITKIQGKNTFVPYALPNEELEIEIEQEKKDFNIAKITKIIKPSEHRISAPCPYYQKCGGCNMMHIDPEYQTILRTEMLKDCFERNGIKIPEIKVVSGSPYNYRARFQLNNGGLSEKSSNNIIPVENCCVAENQVNQWLKQNPFETRPKGRIHLFASDAVQSAGGDNSHKFALSRESEEQVQTKKYKNKNIKQIKKRYSGTSLDQEDIVCVKLLNHLVSFNVKGFFQSNLEVLQKSIKEVCNGLVGKNVLDMYAGCGTFSVFLGDFFEKVTLVEHNRDALVFAEQNLTGINHESFGLSGANFVKNARQEDYDAVVIDPPRSGMEKEVCKWLCTSNIPQIRSVSCDPATHARDISYLVKAGYRLERLYLLDFYPNTSHIESLAVLTKENE